MADPSDDSLPSLVSALSAAVTNRWQGLDDRPAARPGAQIAPDVFELTGAGVGETEALSRFWNDIAPHLNGGIGPHYAGYVTGGVTPAGLVGDWLTPIFDNNAAFNTDGAAGQFETETIAMLTELFRLPAHMGGTLTTGATTASTVALAAARQWAGEQQGIDSAKMGSPYGLAALSGSAHSSIAKAMAMIGLGSNNVISIPSQPGRESIDLDDLRRVLAERADASTIVIANAGTVVTGDTDDIARIQELRDEVDFWRHVDAAFGGFAALLASDQRLTGWEQADSITIDLHKWLNVPYESGLVLLQDAQVLPRIFGNTASYFSGEPQPMDFGLENSRRMRALPIWLSLAAYGRQGIADMVARSVSSAHKFAEIVTADPRISLAAPVHLNVVALTSDHVDVHELGSRLAASGAGFLTPAKFEDQPVLRAAFVNWRTDPDALALALLQQLD